MESRVLPGWYPDPDGNQCERFWNGDNWTLKTRPLTTPVGYSQRDEQGISAGWWIIITITGILAIALIIFMSQESGLYY